MILVDTTVWIDFFKGEEIPHVGFLERQIGDGEDLCVCGLILAEVLQGVRTDRQYRAVKSHLDNLVYIPMRREIYIDAASIYRSLRRRGITIRKPIDCMIASVAIASDIPLLHNDRDFNPIEKHCGLKTVSCDLYSVASRPLREPTKQ